MSKKIQGIIFDMDGVLCDSEAFICKAATAMFAERYDFKPHPDDFLPFVGAGENAYICGPAKQHNIEVKLPEDKIRTYEIYLELIKGNLSPLPGAVDFIRGCREKGLKLAVASAADATKVQGNLREIGLPAETFDAIVTGSDVTRYKPDPQCFQMAAEAMALATKNCLVVEDANNGCKAAKAAGAFCLGLTTSFCAEQLIRSGADWTAPDLTQVPVEIFSPETFPD